MSSSNLNKYIHIDFQPGDPLILDYLSRPSVVRIQILIHPDKDVPQSVFKVLTNGEVYEIQGDPFISKDWDMYVDLPRKKIFIKGQEDTIPIDQTQTIKLLLLLLKEYPTVPTKSQIGDAIDTNNLSFSLIRTLFTNLRNLIGREILPSNDRQFDSEIIIIVERKKNVRI